MTFNRCSLTKAVTGVGLGGLLLLGVGLAPAAAKPPPHAPAHGYRAKQVHRNSGWNSRRSPYGNSRYDNYRYGDSRYGSSRYDDYRYGGSRYDDYRYRPGYGSSYRYGSGYGSGTRGPYGDLDRDGRRNYWDKDKDGDGRRNERDRAPKNPRRR